MGMMSGSEELNMTENGHGFDNVESSVGILGNRFCVVMTKRGVLSENVGRRGRKVGAVEIWV